MNLIDHPFVKPLTEFTIDELDKKYSELMGKWRVAKSMNMDQNVLHQIDMMIMSIELEKEKRMAQEEKPDGVVLDTDPIENLPNVPAKFIPPIKKA